MFFEYDPTATLEGRERLTDRAQALRQALLPLREYIRLRSAKLDITSPYAAATVQHMQELEAAFRAVADYHGAVEELVALHLPRQKQAEAQELLAEREADPVYRLGYVRGYRRGLTVGQEAHERVLGLYAQHGLLPSPASSSPLVTRVQRYLAELGRRYPAVAPAPTPTVSQQAA
ncbi:hypothetical protein GO988_21630 [Hymenobacter sp. HMF4947]|uniref:Uncharacterized protein n=1 Tax=Hymenobacter ginkgonis TaxID=2682976 RepID=A0A7K1TKK0_9BACT|nr:hypothetical protein [Hymenobacter ginkgonis]MVN78939.1 hypothetical protein [Hymenobacter ginkgonis]